MREVRYPSVADYAELVRRPALPDKQLERGVQRILKEVKRCGDEAVRDFTKQFDGAALKELEVPRRLWEAARQGVDPELRTAIVRAAEAIERFHAAQQDKAPAVETNPGVVCWRRSLPIERVGVYVPGGSAPLLSTALMLIIPARLAGCREIIACTPPSRTGAVAPALLCALAEAGATRVFAAGGAQAIAALAYGTETIPRVDKIFGPGNQYVTKAKQLVAREGIAIDLPAGPSEVLVIADDSAQPTFIAADLLSQAEHGPDSQVLLVTTSERILREVSAALAEQLEQLPRRATAARALENSLALLVPDLDAALEFSDAYAPEHLILAVQDPDTAALRVRHAGSVFLGHFTPEAAGDYASGTNHTLPTGGYARVTAGVSLDSFVRKVTFQKITPAGLAEIGPVIAKLADAEGLQAHRAAVLVRLQHKRHV